MDVVIVVLSVDAAVAERGERVEVAAAATHRGATWAARRVNDLV